VKATAKTEVSVLGANGEVLEYAPKVTPKTTFRMESDGMHIRTMRSQRLQDNKQWPNPVVLRLTNVEPALVPPRIETAEYRWDASSGSYHLEGDLLDMGGAASLQVGFEYRSIDGEDIHARTAPWIATPVQTMNRAGKFSTELTGLPVAGHYEFRAVVRHPLLALYGVERTLRK
jgi:alpha-L-fucosidase